MGDESPAPAVLPVPGWLRGAVGGGVWSCCRRREEHFLAADDIAFVRNLSNYPASAGKVRHHPTRIWQDGDMQFRTRQRKREANREAVLHAAAQLFLELGYHRTTLNEVARRLNITKPSLYTYFRGKDEILHECYRMGQAQMDEAILAIEASDGDGLDKLKRFIRAYARVMMVDFGACLVRLDIGELAPPARREALEGLRRCDGALRRYIAQGIGDGSIVECDPKMAAFAIAGSLNGIGHWFRRDGPSSADEVTETFVERLTAGLARRRG